MTFVGCHDIRADVMISVTDVTRMPCGCHDIRNAKNGWHRTGVNDGCHEIRVSTADDMAVWGCPAALNGEPHMNCMRIVMLFGESEALDGGR